VGWFIVGFGYELFTRSYIGDCEVVSKSRRRGRYTEVALLCYDAFGYPYIKAGSRRSYRNY
jgi:hypothetical protein